MRRAERGIRLLAYLLLVLAYPAGDAAAFELPEADGWYAWSVEDVDNLRVFVKKRDGKVQRIHTPRHDCWYRVDGEVTDLDSRRNAESIDWLARQVTGDNSVSSNALAVIAAHEGIPAFEALKAVLADRANDQDLREEALFWMASSDNDAAFAYLDDILSR